MRVPNEQHLGRPWRIHALARGFTLEDVWENREVSGGTAEFDDLVAMATAFDPASPGSRTARLLWTARDQLGRLSELGRISAAPDAAKPLTASEAALVASLDEDLAGTADDVRFAHLPFRALYRTQDEFAAHLANATVHGILHLGWAGEGATKHCEMAVYVKPNGWFGRAYMRFIKPFRYVVVYPAIERSFAEAWRRRRSASGQA